MTKKKNKKPPPKSKTLAKNKGGRKTKYTPEFLVRLEKSILITGSLEIAQKESGISHTTFYNWKKNKPEVQEVIDRAMRARERFGQKEFLPELYKAFGGLNELLTGYTKELKKTEKTTLYNDATKQELDTINLKVTTQEVYYPPQIRAIEKVIGSNNIRNNVYIRAVENETLKGEGELFKLIFGNLTDDEIMGDYNGVFVLRVQLDMMKIRYMEAHIQREYDKGNISMEQWVDLTGKLRKDYAFISDKLETRSQKLFKGKSYSEIVLQVNTMWQAVVEVFEEAVGTTYEREGKKKPYTMPPDVQKMVMQRAVQNIRGKEDATLLVLHDAPI